MTVLDISDLQLGDVILYTPLWKENGLTADHVAIVTKIEQDQCWVTHAIKGNHFQVMETLLIPPEEEEGIRFEVFRCADARLAKEAAEWAQKWSHRGIPYGTSRNQFHARFEEELNIEALPTKLKDLFDYAVDQYQKNWFRVVKYTARRETQLSRNKGVTCGMLVMLAYQVAELARVIGTQEAEGITWITDKYSSGCYDQALNTASFFGAFTAYRQRLRNFKEYMVPSICKSYTSRSERRFPSIVLWDEEQHGDPEAFFMSSDRVFPLDAKLATPSLILYFYRQEPEGWMKEGDLILPPITLDNNSKNQWRATLTHRTALTSETTRQVERQCEIPLPDLFVYEEQIEDEEEFPFGSPRLLMRARSFS